MYTAVKASWALLLSMALLMLGNGLQGSLIGLRATLEGFSTQWAGFLMSGYFVGFLLGSTLTPKIVSQVGHIRVFAALASLASTLALIHSVFIDPTLWFAMRVVTGFCMAGIYIVAESWLNDLATNQTRGQLLSVYMVIMIGGMAAGQLLLNLADPGGFQLFILISVLLSLALLPVLLSVAPAPSFAASDAMGLRQLYRSSPLGVSGCMVVGLSNGAVVGMGVIYAELIGFPLADISLFMGLVLLGSVVLQWPIGQLSDRLDRRWVILVVTALAALMALLAIPASHLSTSSLLVVAFLFGGLSFPMYSLCVAHTNDNLEPRQMVAASSSLVLAVGIGAALGPAVAAAVMELQGPNGLFAFLALVHGVLGVFALYRMTRRRAVPLADQGLCVAIPPAASPVAMAMVQEASGGHVDALGERPDEPISAVAGAEDGQG
ncbi:MFS transporter [Pseudomonas sp. MBLB4136]|uniref:MFS transporter n=1 Tax=Pseudomonas sp. MBLB4136 TaxID=3451558 RepID=UPI003F74C1AC